MRKLLVGLALGCLAVPGIAQQHSVIVSPDLRFLLKGGSNPQALTFVDDQESLIVTPSATGSYQARPFRTFTYINVAHGDGDNDGDLADRDRYGDVNLLMVRHRPPHAETGPFGPGELWMSHTFNTAAAVATSTGIRTVLDGTVYRCRNGNLEIFVDETTLGNALGDPNGNFDLDGMVQDAAGNLYFSFWEDVTVAGNFYADGELVYLPASAITYDANGFVAATMATSTQRFAREADFNQMVQNSGAVDQAGLPITAVGDVGAIALDPNGGTWVSPENPSLSGPNLLFASNFANTFDTVWTTSGGGQLAVINGRTMGYTSGNADGSVLGIWPTVEQDAINALVVVPAQTHWIALDLPRAGEPVQGGFTLEVGRCQPGSVFGLLLSAWPLDGPGGWVQGTPLGLPGNPLLELDLATLIPLGSLPINANGYASLRLPAPAFIPPGTDFLVQGIGIPFGSTTFGLSASSNLTFR